MKRIPLPGGLEALIDDADYLLVQGFRWRALKQKNTTYVHAWHNKLHIYLHRLVIGAGPNDRVDHANMNGLDNQRNNLRMASRSQNGSNRPAEFAKPKTSRYKGVYFDTSRKRWAATIHTHKKTTGLGRFDTEEAAARAYNQAALDLWGEFARLNDVPPATEADERAANNRRRKGRPVEAFGDVKSCSDWATDPRCAVSTSALEIRIFRLGWDPEHAITTPSAKAGDS